MSTCGTCRHWAEGAQGRPGFGNCQRIGDAGDYAGENGHLALANNGDGTVSSWLETRAEFGCVLHEPDTPSPGEIPFSAMTCMRCGGRPILAGTGHCRSCLGPSRSR